MTEQRERDAPDYSQAVYDYLLTLGSVGDEVNAAIYPYLAKRFGISAEEATKARVLAMADLTRRGLVLRTNPHSTYVRILA